ncbi:hypothetical protein [Streptacidiphilus cavernicola]|uniref:Uncharacterized protein n=1 Tax=Streptacidiphilus cavernicola TaxID=3342716 RepID=A0ABV6VYA2_9ACTN
MAYEGYLDLGGNEVVNNARVRAAASAYGIAFGDCDPCSDMLPEALCGEEYATPDTGDQAPWYDPTRPESARFLGVFGLSVTGLSSNPVARTPVELPGDGALLGPIRRTHREIAYTVQLLALDQSALVYGREWLASVLRGDVCGTDGCQGAEMTFFASCPCEEDCEGLTGRQELRVLCDVGLLEGPTPGTDDNALIALSAAGCDSAQSGACGPALAATCDFTLVAGKPRIVHPAVRTAPTCTTLHLGDKLPGYDPDAAIAKCPPPVADCLVDPLCAAPPLPPQPPVPRDPCYPTGAFNAVRSFLSVDATCMADWLDHVPVVEVYAGNKALRRMTVRFHMNPAALPCAANVDPCNACVDLDLPYLPAGSTLTLDGRVQRASVDCTTATPVLFGARGTAFSWPTFSCPSGFCVEVITADDVDTCAYATVDLFPLSDAA